MIPVSIEGLCLHRKILYLFSLSKFVNYYTSVNAMKTMTVSKSVITAVALILLKFSHCSDADICRDGTRAVKDRDLCPQHLMATSKGDLPCNETVCDGVNSEMCELSGGRKVNNTLLSFTTQMCLTNDRESPSRVGVMFNWTLLAGQEVTGLKILVYNEKDYPQIWILLDVDLTGLVDSEIAKIFSTDCLASERIQESREYFVSVQVLPSQERYRVADSFTFTPDCSRPKFSERALCPAAPWKRPNSKGFCNGKVEVTVNSGFPPGLTTETEFGIVVLLCSAKNTDDCIPKRERVQVEYAQSGESKMYFEDLKPGVYRAMMAFADEDGIPCDTHYYKQNGTSVVNKPPDIYLELKESHDTCSETVEITVSVTSYEHTLDSEFNVAVILSGSGVNEGQDISKILLITTNPNMSLVTENVIFKRVPPGNYTILTKFVDEYYTKCSSDETLELTVNDCRPPTYSRPPHDIRPPIHSHPPTYSRPGTHTSTSAGKFWDLYGKLILGVGILSIFISVIAFLLHQRWLKLKRKVAEQQRNLTEDQGSFVDGLSSIADTTVQESHLHRFLNDTGRGWSSQIDCTSTELKYSHQPMSADSGVPSDEFETQSWQENESIAFSV
ncbi:hypothetical protein HOLleu_05608 [Holothuria leucospilota]|uniref:Uncharacterized protein n=1 Tax=Holothuria leucospilota TaxID=206669 RepID=A0A9Q1CKZ8_HOLLE|nr:hypothetical protein HOLleu_05608 [Holothuria leucospilota]